MKLSCLALTSILSATATAAEVAAEDVSSSSLRSGSTSSSATLDHGHHHDHRHDHRHDASSRDHAHAHAHHRHNHHHQKHPHPYSNSNAFSQVQDSDTYKRLQVRSEPNKLRNSNININHESVDEATKAAAAAAAAAVVVEEEEACAPAMSKEELQQLVRLEENGKTVIMNQKMKMHLDSGFLTTSSCTSKEKICIQRASSSTTGICIDKHILLDDEEDSTTIGGGGGYTDPSSGVDGGMMMMDASSQALSPSSMLVVDEFDHHRSLQETCNDNCILGRPSVYDQYAGPDLYLSEIFRRCTGSVPSDEGPCPSDFEGIPVNCWNTTNVKYFDFALAYQPEFNEPVDCWDTSSGTNFTSAFSKSYEFGQDISMWDVSKAVTMKNMFYKVKNFSQNLNTWMTGEVTDMSNMFEGAYFDGDINSWDTSKVTSLRSMFFYAYYFNKPVSGWDTSKNVELSYTFYHAKNFNQDVNTWDVSKVNYMRSTFSYYLKESDETQNYFPAFNSPLNNWDTSNLLTSNSMFYNNDAFNQSVSSWDVSQATSIGYMFAKASKFNDCLTSWALSVQPDIILDNIFTETACAEPLPQAGMGPWCQSVEEGCPATLDPPGPSGCVNTEFKLIPNEVTGTEMFCGGVLNQLFAPPQDVEELKKKCNTRIKSTDPNNDMVLVSEVCPTFCNFDTCCSIDDDFLFLLNDGKTKRCGGLLNALIEDSSKEGKAALAEQCAAELEAVSGGTVVVEDICTGLCRKGCEVVDCDNKRPDQFLLIPDDSNGNKLNCDEFLKDMSKVEKKTVCKEKISIFNVKKNKILKKKQTPKKTCPLYCSNRCKKQLALQQ